ncbi:transcriptional regulator [Enterobacteriaceae bacterium BIT-l23]|uniref:transcriptional regulator n=1 Tax=Jejubacter sp. L23 TaxID=3092086 RepID=UPI0015850235|nr:transcriptional regulator [Enterobacteriaceae bacterium BIT-l23]
MQREEVLEQALHLLEREGLASTTLEMVAAEVSYSPDELRHFWPDREALLYDALRYHSQQIEAWRRQLIHDETQSPQQKLLGRYDALTEFVGNQRYPGCLFIAACSVFPDADHPIHQLAIEQKQAAWNYTHELLTMLEVDDPDMVAKQMELVLEGCLSRLLVHRSQQDVDTARRLAEDILRLAQCRTAGALT